MNMFDILATSGQYRCPRLMRLLPATEPNRPPYLSSLQTLYIFLYSVLLFFSIVRLFAL